jgi:Cu(I)/Ag(I) efflux system membrane protein CusA/SilA
LAGLAAENSVVMLSYLDRALELAESRGEARDDESLRETIIEGALQRVRPLLMTFATTLLGLLPIMFGTETGTRVMKRLAAPMVGGLISAALFTLIVLPAVYFLWRSAQDRPASAE